MSRAETFTFNARREIPSRELAAAVGGIAVPLASSFPTTWPIMEGLAIDGAYIADDGDSPDPVRRFLPTTAGPSGTLEIGSARTEPYDPGGVQPIYGAPVVDPGGVQPIYGAPVVEPCDPPDFGGIQPIYGAPVVRNDEPAPEVAASIEMA